MSTEPWHMTPEQIAPHQVPVTSVTLARIWQSVTGDWFQAYATPDGEVIEIRVACGAYAPEEPVLTREQAAAHALDVANQMRQGRAERMTSGLPVTCQLTPTGGWS